MVDSLSGETEVAHESQKGGDCIKKNSGYGKFIFGETGVEHESQKGGDCLFRR